MAIAHLKRKFGNPQLLLEELAKQLEGCRASTTRVEDQMTLYEEISSILNQMALKGECLDTVVLQKQVLSKFSERVQRHVLRKKHEQTASEPWTTEMLLSHISDFLDTEVEIKHYLQEQSQEQPCKPSQNNIVKKTTDIPIGKERIHTCFYCKRNDHSPKDCPELEFGTQEQRLEHMKRFSLCMNCGGTNHIASACTKGACRLCHQKGHHTSICPQTIRSTVQRPMHSQRKPATAAEYPKPPAQRKTRQHFVSSTPNEDDEDEDNVEAITCMKTTSTASKTKQCVLVGEAQVFNVNTRALETIHILLDTGADRSFISEDLACRLQLENTHTVRLSVNTFGNQKSREMDCGVTDLQLFDHEGKSHWFQVTRIHHITESLQRNELTYEDKHYIAENNIKLSVSQDFQEVRPEVLLGCSDAFSLIDREDQSSKVLPSGLRLIPSRLGYLITGPVDNYVSNTAIKTTPSSAIQESNQKWDEFLALQNSGIQEFTGTKTQELEMENDKVWRNFKATIEHHKDGYYVQLPWKEEAVFLPDNKLIAYKRLCLNLSKLQTTPDILRQYHQTFEEQLNKGIIEEMDVCQPPTGKIVHYLSHQAVITPAKEFTKLRVVFDASAHFKGHPSLNDVLHQGPVILPLMRDMLLRFRIGNIAMIADVEKAFLQIRLKTDDRDATRCLWVRDPTKPPTETNLVEYRFTRVTFGLNCSPFLLAGTVKYHLQENTLHKELAKEVYRNVYVDNVILTASNEEEAMEKYKKSKAIFAEMNMNLRGYLTSNEEVNKVISSHDKSMHSVTKVLGVCWDSVKDHLILNSQLASIVQSPNGLSRSTSRPFTIPWGG
nr:Zinc finger domain containing protein [Haemonchus contortus]